MPKEISYQERLSRERIELIRQTLMELPDVCADFIRSIDQTTSPLTRLEYARDLRVFFRFLSTEIPEFGGYTRDRWNCDELSRVTARHMHFYLDYLTLYVGDDDAEYANGELGKQRKLSSLRAFYKYLYRYGLIPSNPAELVDMPKRHEKPIIRLEIDEVARLLDTAESGDGLSERQKAYHEHTKLRDMAMLTLFLGTGIRVSECVGLNIDDLDFEQNGFTITRKGGNQVILYFPDEVADVLKEYLIARREQNALPGHEQALFLSTQRKRMGVRAVEKMVKKYALHAAPLKRKISPHKLRSTYGTNLYRETGDIYLVADVLGHSDVNTTKRHYAAMADDRRRMAAKSVILREKPSEKPEDEE